MNTNQELYELSYQPSISDILRARRLLGHLKRLRKERTVEKETRGQEKDGGGLQNRNITN